MKKFDDSRILTTGSGGMLGSYVDFGLRPDSTALDILDREKVVDYVQKHTPSAIIHLAGATDMTRTEKEPMYAYELNVRGTYNVACAARSVGATMVYVSTSRVFNGEKKNPYTEEDIPEPESHYARTKYFGELITAAHSSKYIIARTSWVFGGGPERDNKFYGNIIRQLDKSEIVALSDVYGSPTYGKDFIMAIKELLANEETGVVHIANAGVATRHDLAHHIAQQLKPSVTIKAVDRSFFSSGATLPSNESIVSSRCTLRPWQEALEEYIEGEWKLYLQSAKITP
ncbi:MAG: dTDP-4-dehydrorhamnose reductase [Candidatus Azotimanducaceae bacterium]|jgi:dTDP-4-dehydrorhamnose reductase